MGARIAIGSDHRGYFLKQALLPMLEERGHRHQDMGCHNEEAVDYPDVAEKVARAVANGEADYGVLVCGTGIGMSIAANKVPGIRAALCSDPMSARMARQHNDSNVLCMGGAMVGECLAREIAAVYLSTGFEGGRHARRTKKISRLEDKPLSNAGSTRQEDGN